MTPALRTLAEIEAAGAALAATEPPLTDEEITDLVVILSPAFPTVRMPKTGRTPAALPQAA